jgi:hypothetical protein
MKGGKGIKGKREIENGKWIMGHEPYPSPPQMGNTPHLGREQAPYPDPLTGVGIMEKAPKLRLEFGYSH